MYAICESSSQVYIKCVQFVSPLHECISNVCNLWALLTSVYQIYAICEPSSRVYIKCMQFVSPPHECISNVCNL